MSTTTSSLLLENMEEVKQVFNCFDTNKDGKISKSELGSVLSALGSHISEAELQQMMNEIDKDGDGFIDLNEFAEFHKGDVNNGVDCGGENGVKEMQDAFNMYDKDQNGLISASELHLVLHSLGESCSLEDCGRMIGSVDSDGDGFVNFEEFTKMMKSGLQ